MRVGGSLECISFVTFLYFYCGLLTVTDSLTVGSDVVEFIRNDSPLKVTYTIPKSGTPLFIDLDPQFGPLYSVYLGVSW